jgi:hypothetical protein
VLLCFVDATVDGKEGPMVIHEDIRDEAGWQEHVNMARLKLPFEMVSYLIKQSLEKSFI